MAFSEETIRRVWIRAGGKCTCRRRSHSHSYTRCNKSLVKNNRGMTGRGRWEAHHIDGNGGDIISNCEILCFDCHVET